MTEDATQPIDRRIMEAAKRHMAMEEARKAEEAAASDAQQPAPAVQRPTSVPLPGGYDPAAATSAADLQAQRDALPADRVFLREVKKAVEKTAEVLTPAPKEDAPDLSGLDVPAQIPVDEDEQPSPLAAAASAVEVPVETALFLDAFFAELEHCGVTDYVVSPGSRSTPLAMKAFERFGDVYVDVDERGAAFFALGLAKATGNPVAVICTSGTAVGNWMPAVLEAESSRVPLLLLSGDRPPRLQHVGAPQTCDQLKIFGDHVKKFVQMPQPSADPRVLAYARQMALDACIAAHGAIPGAASCDGGPVHLNFPFEEPLKPAKRLAEDKVVHLPPTVMPGQGLLPRDAAGLFHVMKGKRVIALCGEGSCNGEGDAQVLLEFARKRNIPLLADPLSGLRRFDDPLIIDCYDSVFGEVTPPQADVVIRFGRWPVSKRCCQAIGAMNPLQMVVDMRDTRDASSSTDLFVRCAPTVFAQAMLDVPTPGTASAVCAREWGARNDAASMRIESVRTASDADEFEGAYVNEMLDMAPEGSLVFSANSMSIRAIDTFYCRSDKDLTLLCNRGLNGIDGTVSSALGAAQAFAQTTLLIGDLALLHDANALALQGEMRIREARGTAQAPSVVIVALNNNGGGIFDMLPQKSDEDYFGRLFLTPQNVDLKHLASAFDVPYRRVTTLHDFRRVYSVQLGEPGINIIDVSVPLEGVRNRYGRYW